MKKRLLKIVSVCIVALCSVFILAACVDADHVVQMTKMQSMGYTVHDITTTGGYDAMGAKAAYHFVINDTDGNPAEQVYVLYFASDHDAITYENSYDGYRNQTIHEEETEDKGYSFVRIGKIVIHGTDYAFNDALA